MIKDGKNSIRLVVYELDGNLWNSSKSVHECEPPFRKVSEGEIADKNGVKIRMNDHSLELLDALRAKGVYIALAKFELEERVFKALECLGINEHFSYLQNEWVAEKNTFKKLIKEGTRKIFFEQDEIKFIEDKGAVVFLKMALRIPISDDEVKFIKQDEDYKKNVEFLKTRNYFRK